MKKIWILISIPLFFLSGCGIAVVPQSTATARVDLADNSISETKSGITITARIHDQEVAPYLMDNNLTSFNLTLANNTHHEVSLPLESFLLVDNEDRQYRPVEPDRLQEILKQNSPYLIPYPYVGYYYLEDIEKAGAARTFDSALPYYAENHPQDTLAGSLPAGAIIPGSKVSGTIFFMVDFSTLTSIELRGYLPGTSMSAPADFVLPFSIEKK
ncbi:MAG: hypothetical protein A2X84_08920 [Desulfuromonadaceae bacterium GWC2_58_13]|nr:MAG: hypothetical protein A2X84_08920 [Desulfuromonadaceae bacterium GWC2_58_13]